MSSAPTTSDAPPFGTLGDALERIREAARVLAPHVRRTPTVSSYTFSESAGCEVFLKLESLQRTGALKLRGALFKMHSLGAEERARGVIAASAGNHAQGVALAARLCGAPATIVMPVSTALVKVRGTEEYGAEVVLHGENWNESQELATQLARERGLVPMHPFDDPLVIAGQGTVGLEVIDDVPELDAIVVPVGGGGLIAGIALAVKALRPGVRVIGVQAEGAAPTVRSFHGGERVAVASPRTVAEGIRVGTVGEHTFGVIRRYVDDCVTVADEDIVHAVTQTMEKSRVVAEAAGVAGIAALIAGRVTDARRVCAVVSGGNIDLNQLARIIELGLANQGRTHLVRLRMHDAPGQLKLVLDVLRESGANILDIQHYRAGWKVPLGFVDVEILLEVRRPGQGVELDRALREQGFDLRGDPGA